MNDICPNCNCYIVSKRAHKKYCSAKVDTNTPFKRVIKVEHPTLWDIVTLECGHFFQTRGRKEWIVGKSKRKCRRCLRNKEGLI